MLMLVIPLLGFMFVFWVADVRSKKRAETRLGRKVTDRELTSIAMWMESPDENENAPSSEASRRRLSEEADGPVRLHSV